MHLHLAAITHEQILRGIGLLAAIVILAGLALFIVGCRSPLIDPCSPLPVARPAISRVTSDGLFTWHFLARNGVVVHASSQAFRDKGDLIAHYAHVRQLMQSAERPTTITRAQGDTGGFRWSLYDESTGERVEIADQPFASANAARENYNDLRRAVLDCPPQDLDQSGIAGH